MSTIPSNFRYHFFPVGQGLFAAGCIRGDDESTPRYSWVYDCGTSSADELLGAAIDRLDGILGTRKRLDLVTLSHFDHDHISGVCRLIEKFEIGTLMLPYMPLAQRLIVAFAEDLGPYDRFTNFFLNPVEYLLTQGGPGIERILFVLASGDDESDLPPEAVIGPHRGDNGPEIDFGREKPDDEDELFQLSGTPQATKSRTRIEFLRRGSSIRVGSLWEFVPYNDDPAVEIHEDFRNDVLNERVRLLSSKLRSRNNALRRLKRIYDEQFGKSSEERNLISLFLYSGPIYGSWRHAWIFDVWQFSGSLGRPVFPRRRMGGFRDSQKCSVIYSGDGYLDSTDRLQRLLRFFRKERIARTGPFQVMHHGAEANWYRGVAGAIAPSISIFSSDPERKKWGHPHACVLRDFWPYGPCQVDKSRGVTIAGALKAHNATR